MNLFTTEKLLEYLSPEGLEKAIKIAHLQDILMSLDKSNINFVCNYFLKSIYLRDYDLISRFIDNIFICCKYREFFVDHYAILIYSLYQIILNASKIQNSVNLGLITKENIDYNILTFQYLVQTDSIIESYISKDLDISLYKNGKVKSKRKSLILGNQLNENENQILSVINLNKGDKTNDRETIENESQETDIDYELDDFFNGFIMNSNSILDFFRDRIFTINQSVTKQPWRLYCIYRCMEIFNDDGFYKYIQNFYDNSLVFEIDQITVFAFFAPIIKNHSPSLFSQLYDEMKKLNEYSRLPHSFNNFFYSFESNDEANWDDHSFILENCGFRENSPFYAVRHDDVNFFIENKKRYQIEVEKGNFVDNEFFIDYNMRVNENVYLRYRQLRFRCTLLQLAAYYASEKCFSFLLDNGADPKLEDDIGLNVLHFAVVGGSNKIIYELQEKGFQFDIGSISLIVESHRLELFQWILSVTQIDLEESFLQTGTILHRACSANNILIILFCISNGINVNVYDNLNLTPLFYAAVNRSIDAINVLLSHKNINWSLSDNFRDTPLHGAAKSCDCDTFIAVMNHKDADLNVKDFRQKSPFKYAISEGNYDIVRMVISKYGNMIDFSEIDLEGQNLCFSALFTSLSTFIIICNYQQIDLNQPRFDGCYLLHLIASSNFVDKAEVILVQDRIDPNVTLPDGTTPLHIAAKQGFAEIVQLLINNIKTDVNVKDKCGLTPLYYAIKHIKTDVVKILIDCERINQDVTVVFFTF